MAEKMTSVNPKMIIWARENSGDGALGEAEEEFGKEKLAKWEAGDDSPTYAELRKISKFYGKPLAVFFFPEPPTLDNLKAQCRTLPEDARKIFNRNITKLFDLTRVMQLNFFELNDGKNPAETKFTGIVFDTANIKVAAKQLRQILNTSIAEQKRLPRNETAFAIWRERLNAVGIYVFKQAFKDDSVSGFCLYDDEFPVICVNNSLAHSRQIFTLFHEIFHLMLKISGVDLIKKYDVDVERECNKFAGEFLVPSDDFISVYSNKQITTNTVETWANLYRVSREVIIYRLYEAGVITYDELQEKYEEYKEDYLKFTGNADKKKKDSGDYYATQVIYKGKDYVTLAYREYYANKITLEQLSKYMEMKIPNLRKLASKKGWGEI